MTDLSYLKEPQITAEQVAAEADAMTVKNVLALCTAIVTWLTYNIHPNVGAEIAAIAERIEESWAPATSEEATDGAE